MVAQSVIVKVDEEEGAQKRCLGCQVQGHWEGDGELVLQPQAAQGTNLLRILNENWLIFKMQKLFFYLWSTLSPGNCELFPLIDTTRVTPGFSVNLGLCFLIFFN